MSEENNQSVEEELIKLNEKLERQEGLLIEQEHRFFKVLKNFFVNRKKWPKGDKRRNSATTALFYSLFFSPTTVAVTGGTVAVFSLLILFWQTNAVLDQNVLLRESNEQQNEQFVNQRISLLTKTLYDTTFNATTSRLKSVALKEYVNLMRQRDSTVRVDLQRANLKGIIISNYDLSFVDLTGANFDRSKLRNVSLTNSRLVNTSWLKSVLLKCDFTSCDLQRSDFGEMISTVERENTVNVDRSLIHQLYMTSMRKCNFTNCEIGFVIMDRCLISECNFQGTRFRRTSIHQGWFNSGSLSINQFASTFGIPDSNPLNEEDFNTICYEGKLCRKIFIGASTPAHPHGILDTCIIKDKLNDFFYRNRLVGGR